MATPDDMFDLEVPTQGWAFLRNDCISWLTKVVLTTAPSASVGTVVALHVHHKRGRATGHITIQASAFEFLAIQWLERMGFRVVKPENIKPELRNLLQSCYDLLESPSY